MNRPTLQLGQGGVLEKIFSLEEFKRFADLSEDFNPIHTDPSFSAMSRFGRPVCHGMLLYGIINRVLGSQVPGPGTVQIKQEFTFPYPTYTDERIKALVWITDIRGPLHYELNTIIAKQNGNMGCQGTATVLLPEEGFDTGPVSSFEEGEPEGEGVSHKGLETGQRAQTKRKYSEGDLEERMNLTGDANPIFISEEYAQECGFEKPLVPSDLLGAMISDLLGTDLPGLGTNWLKQEFRFLNPAYVGEELTAEVEITRIRPDKDLVNLKNICTKSDGTTVLEGRSLVLVKDLIET